MTRQRGSSTWTDRELCRTHLPLARSDASRAFSVSLLVGPR